MGVDEGALGDKVASETLGELAGDVAAGSVGLESEGFGGRGVVEVVAVDLALVLSGLCVFGPRSAQCDCTGLRKTVVPNLIQALRCE